MPTAQGEFRPLAGMRAGCALRGPTISRVQQNIQNFHEACLMISMQDKRFAIALASVSSTLVAKRQVRMS